MQKTDTTTTTATTAKHRTMQARDGRELRIKEHIITKNFWEYYVIDDDEFNELYKDDPETVLAYVMGADTEMGHVWLPEIKPFILSRTKDLSQVAPMPGWIWKDWKTEK